MESEPIDSADRHAPPQPRIPLVAAIGIGIVTALLTACGGDGAGGESSGVLANDHVAADPASGAPRSVDDAGCEEELRAVAGELWPGGERPGSGSRAASALDNELSRIAGEATRRWPETFAGAWGDFGETDRLYIGFTARASENVAELAEGFACPGLLIAVDREYSIDDLEQLQREIGNDREPSGDGDVDVAPGGIHSTDIDPARGVVVAFVEDVTSEAIAEIDERYGDQVVVEEQQPLIPLAGMDE